MAIPIKLLLSINNILIHIAYLIDHGNHISPIPIITITSLLQFGLYLLLDIPHMRIFDVGYRMGLATGHHMTGLVGQLRS